MKLDPFCFMVLFNLASYQIGLFLQCATLQTASTNVPDLAILLIIIISLNLNSELLCNSWIKLTVFPT
jgi:hypothetical protein